MRQPDGKGQRGMALPLVLWALMLLGVIAASLNGDARESLQAARNDAAAAQAEALADAGIYRAVLGLLDPRPERRWRADGRPYAVTLGGATIRVRVQDAAGLVDLNTGAESLLRGLMAQAGLPASGADALVAGIVARRRAFRPNGTTDGRFQDVTDLVSLPGVTSTLYARLEPFLTVATGLSGIDATVAPPEVLLALPGAPRDAVEALLAARQTDNPGVAAEAAALAGGLAAASPQLTFSVRSAATVGGASFGRQALLVLRQTPHLHFAVTAWRRWPAASP